jgi:hypothetical protein
MGKFCSMHGATNLHATNFNIIVPYLLVFQEVPLSCDLHESPFKHVGFEVLTAVSSKMAVFWVVAPCSLVEVYQRFIIRALIMEATRTSETLVNFYQTTQRYNPEDSHLPFEHVDSTIQTVLCGMFVCLY